MKLNYLKTVFLSFLLVCSTSFLYSIPNYPATAYGQPECFLQSYSESYNWEEMAKSREFIRGAKSSNPWIVYACEEGLTAYERPSVSSTICVNDIHLMEDFYVADISGDFALLFYYDSHLDGLNIPKEISRKKSTFTHRRRTNGYVGWVEIDKLLLWSIAPRTEDGIFKKVAIVKNVNATVDFNAVPELFDNEACIYRSGQHQYVNAMDFYFTLKKSDNDNALIYQNYQLDGRMVGAKVGWIKSGEYIDWNTRICWEPAFGTDGINDNAYTFATERDARNKNMSNKVSSARLSAKRYNTQFEPRSPVIEYNPNTSTAFLSVIANKNKNNSGSVGDVMETINMLEKALSTINIVFVMDATNSMKSCFDAMSNAVKQISKYNYANTDKTTVKFGAVVYRNYKDAPNGLVEKVKLVDNSNNYSEISTFLSNVKCYSASAYPQEAMFYGLNYAIDNMAWEKDQSNFIILVSDVTSKNPDERGLTTSSVAKKLAQKGINLVAFQARSQKDTEYQNFGAQVCDIIETELQQLGYPRNVEYVNQLQIYYYNRDNSKPWPMRPMGYKKKLSSEQTINASELTNMATSIIKDFIITTQDNINRLREGLGSGINVDDAICDALIERGKIRTCDDLKGIIRLAGYAQPTWSLGKRMFVPCVFLADKEFDDLIRELESTTRGAVEDRRGKLQKVFKKLILSYTGQKLTESSFDNDLTRIIESIEYECGCEFFQNVKKHIENPNALKDNEIEKLINQLNQSISHLRALQNDPQTYKSQDGKKYYYILLKDMPLVAMR